LATAGLGDAAFEGVPGPVGIGRSRFGLAEQVAEVEEMLLGGRAFGEIGPLSYGDEFLREHARPMSQRATGRRVDGPVILLLPREGGKANWPAVLQFSPNSLSPKHRAAQLSYYEPDD
jgi:hypothetical protein